MTAVLNLFVELVTFGPCCVCGIEFAAPRAFVQHKQNTGDTFFCPSGHRQHYTETELMKARKAAEAAQAEAARERQRREWAEQRAKTARHAEAVARGKLRAQSERVKNGVCPCCNRSFQNLRRHMATKHPEFNAPGPGGKVDDES